MSLLDQMQMQQQPQPQGGGGQIGMTQRPRQRFIDRVLMRQRDRMGNQANNQMAQGTNAQAPMLPSGQGFGRM